MGKIFGIGLSRTGTTSLNNALKILGYTSIHYPLAIDDIDKHDAATDASVAAIYKELDVKYPGSKFIMTIRDVGRWLPSMKWLFEKEAVLERMPLNLREIVIMNRMKLYNTIEYDQLKLQNAHNKYYNDVSAYFANRSDLLILDICAGDGWDKLCKFLDEPIPIIKFPHTNAR